MTKLACVEGVAGEGEGEGEGEEVREKRGDWGEGSPPLSPVSPFFSYFFLVHPTEGTFEKIRRTSFYCKLVLL